MKTIISIFGILLISIFLVSANGDHQTIAEEGKKLVDSGISCDKLTDKQLETIGEYFMEQMHPGNQHEAMHEMMGIEEGTEYHEQFHANIARMMYCGESGNMMGSGMMNGGMMGSGGMMGMMPMMMNMMGGGMMGNYPASYDYSNYGYWNIFWILLFAAVIFLIVLIIHRFGIKKTASETPLNILRKRFAKGEITKEEFEDMKKELGE